MIPILAALLILPPVQAKAEVIRDARAMAKAAEAYADKNGKAKQMFMETADETPKWVKMDNEESHLTDGSWEAGDVAFVWTKNKKVSFVSVSMGSASGDWSGYAGYTFRPDGTLAHISYRYAAFSPVEGALVRERIFDKSGKLVHEGAKCQNLKGDKLITGEAAKEMKTYAPELVNYTSVKQLPYYGMLKL